ncbi:MAG: hypothetical protein CMP91_12475 [Gammaproteobacteria bacterium]|nr:hypothetical protein [Gammaproteobacteria bacterium]|tara:strand:- start:110599 stop:111333 length:735 start_codon:yes stop_codon:yes gene_type:complete
MLKKTRYYLGNIARYSTRHWLQKDARCEEVSTIFGASFGERGWHHIKITLQEYDSIGILYPEESTLWLYLKKFIPTSISVLAGVNDVDTFPVFTYPWALFEKNGMPVTKCPEKSRFCGPSSDQFIKDEFIRIINLYQRIKQYGYRPNLYPNSYISGIWLLANDGSKRFIVTQGNHRMAVLSHMGINKLPVRVKPGKSSMVYEKDIPKLPKVKSGLCSQEHAQKIFDYFFENDGHNLARMIGAES